MSLQSAAENTKIKKYLGCLHFSYATHRLTFNKSGLFPRNYKSRSSKISFFLFFFFNKEKRELGIFCNEPVMKPFIQLGILFTFI